MAGLRAVVVTGLMGVVAFACGGGGDRSSFDTNGGQGTGTSTGDQTGNTGSLGASSGAPTGPGGCVGLQCQVHDCGAGKSTTLSGTVYDPAGKNPLYNVVVYVPNAPVQPLTSGATCDSCNSLYTGSPLVTAVTDAAGKFTLTNVPDGKDIPLVVQVGKWRKQITVPSVTQCGATAMPDKSVTLPKNHTEGDIPNIAISTGEADTLECLLRRVGIDASEYGGGASGGGRIHIFQGGTSIGPFPNMAPNTSPAGPASNTALWNNTASLMNYDMVLLSCEGDETHAMNQQAMMDYAAAGGRVFASHYHYAWFNTGPYGGKNLASWSPGTNDMGDIKANIVTSFPKGQALQDWLTNVGGLTAGELPISQARHNADVNVSNTATTEWIKADGKASPAGATQYLTFNTPLGVKPENQCGRVVFSDLHVGAASGDYTSGSTVVPSGCGTGNLSPQEKALEFMLFDLSSCVTPDNQPPQPPPTVVQ
jgi:hypothetical protein